ncbi:MAG: hypothetical protein HY332_09135 [Chloroflexi bacterium]|nr:hypothetical protein [Chloroflexota bacterium]
MSSPYLGPDVVRGCSYCFDPESALLRRALTQPAPHEHTHLPSAPLLEDIGFFHRLMQQAYAGYPDLLHHRAFDPDAFFAEWAATIRGAGPELSFREGIVGPLVALRRVLPDGHLTIRGAEAALDRDARLTFHEYQGIHAVAFDSAACTLDGLAGARPATFRLAPMLRADGNAVQILTLSAAGKRPSLTIDCGARQVTLQRRPPTPAPIARPPRVAAYEWRLVGDTAVITLWHFAGPAAVRDQLRRLAADYPLHAARPRVLFDLRGNAGGSLEYLDAWIAQACRGEWHSYPRLEIVGALWPCSLWNVVVEQQIREGSVDSAEARGERDRLRAGWAPPPPAQTAHLDLGLRPSTAIHPYRGQVFVLVDRHSGSSGELAAVQLKRALGATLVGERTAGVMQYGEARRFVLPRTGLVCQLPTKRFFFDEDVEAIGWPVDVYLEDIGQDVVAIVPHLDLLATLAGASGETAPKASAKCKMQSAR